MAVYLDLISKLRGEKFTIITRDCEVELGWHLNADEKYAKKSADGESWVVCIDNRPMHIYNDDKQEIGWQRIENLTPTRLKDDEEGLLAWRAKLRMEMDGIYNGTSSTLLEPLSDRASLGIRWYSPHMGIVETI
jgi:hypothetical protein